MERALEGDLVLVLMEVVLGADEAELAQEGPVPPLVVGGAVPLGLVGRVDDRDEAVVAARLHDALEGERVVVHEEARPDRGALEEEPAEPLALHVGVDGLEVRREEAREVAREGHGAARDGRARGGAEHDRPRLVHEMAGRDGPLVRGLQERLEQIAQGGVEVNRRAVLGQQQVALEAALGELGAQLDVGDGVAVHGCLWCTG